MAFIIFGQKQVNFRDTSPLYTILRFTYIGVHENLNKSMLICNFCKFTKVKPSMNVKIYFKLPTEQGLSGNYITLSTMYINSLTLILNLSNFDFV